MQKIMQKYQTAQSAAAADFTASKGLNATTLLTAKVQNFTLMCIIVAMHGSYE